jgi:hypothetical protein
VCCPFWWLMIHLLFFLFCILPNWLDWWLMLQFLVIYHAAVVAWSILLQVDVLMCLLSHCLETDYITLLFYCCLAQTTQKTHVMCQTVSLLVRYQHWAWRGRHRKHSLFYCCVLDRVYIAVAWQHVDQIHYNVILEERSGFRRE